MNGEILNKEGSGETTLPLPKVLEDQNPDPNIAEFNLFAKKGTKEVFKGKQTETFGYNGDYLGPIIRVERGEIIVDFFRFDEGDRIEMKSDDIAFIKFIVEGEPQNENDLPETLTVIDRVWLAMGS